MFLCFPCSVALFFLPNLDSQLASLSSSSLSSSSLSSSWLFSLFLFYQFLSLESFRSFAFPAFHSSSSFIAFSHSAEFIDFVKGVLRDTSFSHVSSSLVCPILHSFLPSLLLRHKTTLDTQSIFLTKVINVIKCYVKGIETEGRAVSFTRLYDESVFPAVFKS